MAMDWSMMAWIFFAVFLYVACAFLLVVEIFVPSFGVLTLCAIACLVGGGTIFFRFGEVSGVIGIITAIILVPIVWVITYRLFPKTPFGRHVILGKPDRQRGDGIPDSDRLQSLLGTEGIVLSPLRPVGMCSFDGHRVECVAETGYIERDSRIRVIRVEGTQLTVRLVEKTHD
jgi:membrane-bound ClpP family serine protease